MEKSDKSLVVNTKKKTINIRGCQTPLSPALHINNIIDRLQQKHTNKTGLQYMNMIERLKQRVVQKPRHLLRLLIGGKKHSRNDIVRSYVNAFLVGKSDNTAVLCPYCYTEINEGGIVTRVKDVRHYGGVMCFLDVVTRKSLAIPLTVLCTSRQGTLVAAEANSRMRL
jgi:hypothetical protein